MTNLRKAARGRDCLVRLPGICNHNPETTVLAHIRGAMVGGMGYKPPDICGVLACSSCHDVIDGRRLNPFEDTIHEYVLDALLRTLDLWTKEGFVK